MGRKGIHNEGARVLIERLEGRVKTDLETARRIFTLYMHLLMRDKMKNRIISLYFFAVTTIQLDLLWLKEF